MAFSARILWERGKPIEVRMAMLSSGGRLLLIGAAPMVLSLVDSPASIMEGRISGSAKSKETQTEAEQSAIYIYIFNITNGVSSRCKFYLRGLAEVGPSQKLTHQVNTT